MICLGDVEKLALPGETIGRCRLISLGISCIAHGVYGKGVCWVSCPSSPFSLLQILFLFVVFHLYHQRPSRLLALCAGLELLYFLYLSWSEILVFSPLMFWSILYRYYLCMKATKLRLNSIQWHNIYS